MADTVNTAGSPAPSGAADESFFDRKHGPFFRRVDWIAYWITFLVAFGVYFHTLAPTVTLEDSGEMAVASDYLGVPHPPGYPIWTLLTWFFQWIFHWVKYFGQPDSNWMLLWKSIVNLFSPVTPNYPNPAWSVGLASAFFGAKAAALIALVISRSGVDMMRHVGKVTATLGVRGETAVSWACGVAGGLLFAFSPVLWSQSTIVEVYSLNAFFMALVILLVYRWMCRPHELSVIYVAAFAFGLGMTNHQTLVFIGPALLVALAFRNAPLFRDCATILLPLAGALIIYKVSNMQVPQHLQGTGNVVRLLLGVLGAALVASPIWMILKIGQRLFTEWRPMLILGSAAVLGLLFYLYLRGASEQNPPMNWGYPRTWEGFKHAVGRGQYEKIDPVMNLIEIVNSPQRFGVLLKEQIFDPDAKSRSSVTAQFTLWLCWPVLVIPFFVRRVGRAFNHWLIVLATAFVFMTFVFMVFQYLKPDIQTLFIGRVQFIQAHAIYAMWIGYGLMLLICWMDAVLKGSRAFLYAASAAVLCTPLVPIWVNAYDEELLKINGGAEQNQHDFGWHFGAWQLEGHRAILQEISEEEKTTYPNPAYPPPMETNAIFFGGTDPGRFVPTYMIYSAHYREDVYLITQNALADNTYMNVMRDLYGDRIWIPAQNDSNLAFQQYVKDVQEGRIPAGAAVSFEGGRVSVQGVQGVMMINGILARMIFDRNKADHAFYVEESYVIPWMYPYLTPHGFIMKINRDPVPAITPEMTKDDHDYWQWYVHRLMGDRQVVPAGAVATNVPPGAHVETVFTDTNGARTVYIGGNPRFFRDVVARKTFSKLRGAIAGIYTYRRMFGDAEQAFRQAIELYPLSPEANFRLADVYMQQFKFTDARQLMDRFLSQDPENDAVRGFLRQIKDLEALDARRRELEKSMQPPGTTDLNKALELCEVYRRMNLLPAFESLAMNIIMQNGVPPPAILTVAEKFYELRRMDLLQRALERYVQVEPKQPLIWMDLGGLYAQMQKAPEALNAVRQAVSLGGEMIRDKIRKDSRFDPVRKLPEFQKLVPPGPAGPGGASPFGISPLER